MTQEWFELLAYCQTAQFNRKQFKARSDSWAKHWARLTYEEQGHVSHELSESLKKERHE